MAKLGLGSSLAKAGLVTPGIVTDSLVLKHNYAGGDVVPVSDGAAYFTGTGTGNRVEITETTFLVKDGDAYTFAFWAKRNVLGQTMAILGHTSTANERLLRFNSSNELKFESNSGGDTITLTQNTNDTNWHHYAITITNTGSTIVAYQDGVVCADSGNVGDDNVTFNLIGAQNTNGSDYEMDGYLCNIGIWTAVLTQAQVKSIMWKNYAGLTSSETENLVSWWNLDSDVADYDADNEYGYVLDNHAGLGPELINFQSSDDYSGTPAAGDWVVTGTNTATWTGANTSGSAFEYLGEDLVYPVESLESGETYRIEFTTDDFTLHYSGTNTMGFSETGSADTTMFLNLRWGENKTASGTFVSNGDAIRIFGRDNMSAKITVSCKKVLGNPGKLT